MNTRVPFSHIFVEQEKDFLEQLIKSCAPDGMQLSIGSFASLEASCKNWYQQLCAMNVQGASEADVVAGSILHWEVACSAKHRWVNALVPDGFVKILDSILDQECTYLWKRVSLWLEPGDFFYRKGQLSEYSFLIYMKRYFEVYGGTGLDDLVQAVVKSVEQLGLMDVPLSKVHRGEHRVNEYDRLLHIALRSRNPKAVELLLDAGATCHLIKESSAKCKEVFLKQAYCPLFEYQLNELEAMRMPKNASPSMLSRWSKNTLISGHYQSNEGLGVRALKWFYKNIWSPDEMLRHWSSKKTLLEGFSVQAAVSAEEYLRYDRTLRSVFKSRGYYIDYEGALEQIIKGKSYVFPVSGRLKSESEVTFWSQMHQALKDHAEGTGVWSPKLKQSVVQSAWSGNGADYLKCKWLQQASCQQWAWYLENGGLGADQKKEHSLVHLLEEWIEQKSVLGLQKTSLQIWNWLLEHVGFVGNVRYLKLLSSLTLEGRRLDGGWTLSYIQAELRRGCAEAGEAVTLSKNPKILMVQSIFEYLNTKVSQFDMTLWHCAGEADAIGLSAGHILLFHAPEEALGVCLRWLEPLVQSHENHGYENGQKTSEGGDQLVEASKKKVDGVVPRVQSLQFCWSGEYVLAQCQSVVDLGRLQQVERVAHGLVTNPKAYGFEQNMGMLWLDCGRYDVLLWLVQEGIPLTPCVQTRLKEEVEYFKQKQYVWQRSGALGVEQGAKHGGMQSLLEQILLEDSKAQISAVLKDRGLSTKGKPRRL